MHTNMYDVIKYPLVKSLCVLSGQSSSATKLKSLTAALQIMTETHSAFQLIHNELQDGWPEVKI